MSGGFKSIGEFTHWQLIVQVVTPIIEGSEPDNGVITYAEWEKRTGLTRQQLQGAHSRACDELLRHGRTLDVVRGIGYRLDLPERRIGMVKSHQKRGLASFERAEDHALSVDSTRYTPEQLDTLQRAGENQMMVNAMLRRRMGNVESRVDRVVHDVRAVDDRVTNLMERLGVAPDADDVIVGEIVED